MCLVTSVTPIILIVNIFVIIEFSYALSPHNKANLDLTSAEDSINRRLRNSIRLSAERNEVKTVLFWTPLFSDKNWNLPGDIVGPEYFKDIQCPVTSCVFTSDKTLLSSVDLYDAVVFHVVPVPSVPFSMPRQRKPHQMYIAAGLEPPMVLIYNGYKQYNWTMHYREDSDITWHHGNIEDFATGQIISPAVHPNWRQYDTNYYSAKDLEKTKQKKRFGAWIVSNCHADSKREFLMNELRQFIPIDVYGQCADNIFTKYRCPRFKRDRFCDAHLSDNYKFYFSFENTVCDDYVTGIFFSKLNVFILPVVFGGANYSQIAPPHSYINADDFDDAKSLAAYLLYLDKNPREYIKYFWWRKFYRVRVKDSDIHCKLCTKINSVDKANLTSHHKVYENLQSWWAPPGICRKARINFVDQEMHIETSPTYYVQKYLYYSFYVIMILLVLLTCCKIFQMIFKCIVTMFKRIFKVLCSII